ncbi:hypothetical protein FAZ95_30510 [Trinickia violacea]|uniref:Fis family transcriptional regulator n=1 Tax=Trinickia violacea TaxID=2571746 RepID=A0A4P8J159_9BURK|nr:hypothetical protein [Trinickia violacea]QCP53394.1 hypothetical protein FAZ95_30510 [Trinickia violacea]
MSTRTSKRTAKPRQTIRLIDGASRLLPMPRDESRRLLISYYWQLDELKSGRGNAAMIGTMAGVIVATCLLVNAGWGEAQAEGMAEVQSRLIECNAEAARTGSWRVDPLTYELLCEVLDLHGEQLQDAPLHEVIKVSRHLDRMRDAAAPGTGDRMLAAA